MPLKDTINVAMHRNTREMLEAVKEVLGKEHGRNDADALAWIFERLIPNKKALQNLSIVNLELQLAKVRDTKMGDAFMDRIRETTVSAVVDAFKKQGIEFGDSLLASVTDSVNGE
jgi:hypothetical protein